MSSSKPYSPTSDASPQSFGSTSDSLNEFATLTAEEQANRRAEWTAELARVDEEIVTLRTVLASKMQHSAELKRKIGIPVWKGLAEDVTHGLKTVKESNMYQKTESVLKSTAEKTTSLFGEFSEGFSSKISQMKNSESFQNAIEKVKTKVSTSRSNSIQSLRESSSVDLKSPSLENVNEKTDFKE